MKRIVTKVVLQNLLATRFLLSSDDSAVDAGRCRCCCLPAGGTKVDMQDLGLQGHLCTAASFGAVKVEKVLSKPAPLFFYRGQVIISVDRHKGGVCHRDSYSFFFPFHFASIFKPFYILKVTFQTMLPRLEFQVFENEDLFVFMGSVQQNSF